MLRRAIFEIVYNFIFFGGLIICGLAAIAMLIAWTLRGLDLAFNRADVFLIVWAILLLSAAPASWLYADRLWAWELEQIAERCGDDFGCESAFYFGAAKGMVIVAALALLAFWARRRRSTMPKG